MSDSSLNAKVVELDQVAEGVLSIVLAPLDGAALPGWTPGAHVDIVTPAGDVRQYSLCGEVDASDWRIAVLHVQGGRGGSRSVHEQLSVGDEVELAGPRNNFQLDLSGSSYLFVAGGIGITPLLPMVRAVAERDLDWTLIYGGRSRASMAFLKGLETFGDRVQVLPEDEVGLLDLPGLLGDQIPGRKVYCCGPEPLLAALEALMKDRPDEQLRVERFKAAEVDASADEAFDVEIASSGKTVTVAPGVSIIDALDDAGVSVEFSCREGTCGTCETNVLSGIPDHRDSVLTDEEKADNDCMMICVGRCLKGPLLLDL